MGTTYQTLKQEAYFFKNFALTQNSTLLASTNGMNLLQSETKRLTKVIVYHNKTVIFDI